VGGVGKEKGRCYVKAKIVRQEKVMRGKECEGKTEITGREKSYYIKNLERGSQMCKDFSIGRSGIGKQRKMEHGHLNNEELIQVKDH